MFSVHSRQVELKTQQSRVILDLRFQKALFSKRKRKAGVFKFLRFEKRFQKALSSRRISVHGRNH